MEPVLGSYVFLDALAPLVLKVLAQTLVMFMEAHGEDMVPAHQAKQWREQGVSQGDGAWWGKRSNVLLAMHVDENELLQVRFYIPGLVDMSMSQYIDSMNFDFQWAKDWLDACWYRVEEKRGSTIADEG